MKSTVKIQLVIIVVLIIILLSLILSPKSAPDSALYSLKRAQEKTFLSLKPNKQDKLNYMMYLLDTRLSELQDLVNNKNYGYVLSTSSKYSTLAGQITDFIMENNLNDQEPQVKQTFVEHQKILWDLYVAYPKNIDNVEWKYIQDDYNYLKIYLDKLVAAK